MKEWDAGCRKAVRRTVNFHAKSLKYISAMKIARQNVLFMQAAPSRAESDTVMVFLVFLPAHVDERKATSWADPPCTYTARMAQSPA